jgi:DNA mismatch endonuclease (patch repair protein)
MRSYNMSKIRSKDTKPELLVRSFLHRQGIRFRLHSKKILGKPDLVLPKYKSVIFVNGCFWHGHEGCKDFKIPKTNIEYWKKKIETNIERDKKSYAALVCQGWRIIVVWGCELESSRKEQTLKKTVETIKNQRVEK